MNSEIPPCKNVRSILVSIVKNNSQLVSKLTFTETVEIVVQNSQFKNNQNNSKKATIQLLIFNHIQSMFKDFHSLFVQGDISDYVP